MLGLFTQIRTSLYLLITLSMLQACGSSDDNRPTYSITADTSTVSFNNEVLQVSQDSIAIKVTFDGPGILLGYAPESNIAPWLEFSTEDVTSTSATIVINVVSADRIPPDLYNATLRVSTGDVEDRNLAHADIDVSLLIWQLFFDTELVSFSGTYGDDAINAMPVELLTTDDQWAVSADVDWLSFDTTSGQGSATINVIPDVSNFDVPGLQQANITFTETTTGASKSIPVELGLDNVYLYADHVALAFTDANNVQSLNKTVTINTNYFDTLPWTATSDATWLSLQPSEDKTTLLITVDPENAPQNSTSYSTIIIQSPDNSVVISEEINVSLYRSANNIETKIIDDVESNFQAIVASPAENVVYVGIDNELYQYHVYSGELLNQWAISPVDTDLEQLIIHPEGVKMLARAVETLTDENGDETTTTHRYSINLTDGSFEILENADIGFEPQRFVHFSGRYFVVTQAFELANEQLETVYWDQANAFFVSAFDTAKSSNTLWAVNNTDVTLNRYTAQVNDFISEKVVTTQTHNYHPELLPAGQSIFDFVVSNDERNIYAISNTSQWISFDGELFTDNGLLETNESVISIALSKNSLGNPHYARINTSDTQGFYVDIYNQQQQNTPNYTQGAQPNSLLIAPDDKRVIINAGSSDKLEFVTLSLFDLPTQSLSFSTTFGDDTIESQQILLTNIGDGWQASSDAQWLVLTTESTDEGEQLVVDIDRSKITTWGLLEATISVYDPLTDSRSFITVTLAVDEVRLYSNYPALSFNQQADREILSQQIQVLSNSESTLEWQASSDANWITLTPNHADNTISVVVDPSLVTTDGIHNATINLLPLQANESLPGTINVSFTKGTFSTDDADEVVIPNVVPNENGLAIDPLRPYLYIAQNDGISVYHQINGELITTITSPLADVALTHLVIHPDGSLLLASNNEEYIDENDQPQTRINHYQVNLADFSIMQLDSEKIDITFRPIKIVMIDGQAVVITQALEYANLALIRQYWDQENAFLTSVVTVNTRNNQIIAFNANQAEIVTQEMAFNAFEDSTVSNVETTSDVNPDFVSGVRSFAINSDGSTLYTANSISEWSIKEEDGFVSQGKLDGRQVLSNINVSVDANDNAYVYRFDTSILPTGTFTLSKYDNQQQLLWNFGYTDGAAQSFISTNYQRLIHYNQARTAIVMDYIQD